MLSEDCCVVNVNHFLCDNLRLFNVPQFPWYYHVTAIHTFDWEMMMGGCNCSSQIILMALFPPFSSFF